MKLINADEGYEVLDRLFAAIQKNNYAATQQMLDDAWEEWCAIPAAYDADKVMGQLRELNENEFAYGRVMYIVKAGGVNE